MSDLTSGESGLPQYKHGVTVACILCDQDQSTRYLDGDHILGNLIICKLLSPCDTYDL